MAVAKGQLVFHGYHTKAGTNEIVEPAVYPVYFPALADDATTQAQFQVDSGYDFHVLEMTHVVAGVAKGTHVPMIVQVNPQNDRSWYIQPAYINTVSALQDGGEPRKLPVKRVLPSQKIITVNFYEATNL